MFGEPSGSCPIKSNSISLAELYFTNLSNLDSITPLPWDKSKARTIWASSNSSKVLLLLFASMSPSASTIIIQVEELWTVRILPLVPKVVLPPLPSLICPLKEINPVEPLLLSVETFVPLYIAWRVKDCSAYGPSITDWNLAPPLPPSTLPILK